jgi:hypothetical protein
MKALGAETGSLSFVVVVVVVVVVIPIFSRNGFYLRARAFYDIGSITYQYLMK